MHFRAIWVVGVALVALVATRGATAQGSASDEAERVRNATAVLAELATAPDRAIPQAVLERAEAIAVFPSVMKGGFVIGGQWGRGVISVREEGGDRWSPPAFLRLAGGSFGAQIGAQAVDLVLVVMNRRGVDNLLRNEFKIGGDASASAGPVGREAAVSTDIQMRAEILSYSRSRGLFAGATINGASVTADREANGRFYGKELESKAVIAGATTPHTGEVAALHEALTRHVPRRLKQTRQH